MFPKAEPDAVDSPRKDNVIDIQDEQREFEFVLRVYHLVIVELSVLVVEMVWIGIQMPIGVDFQVVADADANFVQIWILGIAGFEVLVEVVGNLIFVAKGLHGVRHFFRLGG